MNVADAISRLRAEVAGSARRARPLRPRGVDGGQHLGPGPRRRPARDQAVGVPYDELSPEPTWSCATSTATSSRAITARRRTPPRRRTSTATCPASGGVVHTHSTYATAWASRGEAVPCVLTMMADEFGGEIPIAPVRPDRQRGDRRGGRRHAARPPLEGGAAAEPRRVHDRSDGAGGGEGGGDVRGRRPQRAHRPSARQRRSRSIPPTSTPCTAATRTSTASAPRGP